ncbi:hypothetical protein VitviT2T_019695 [Vitis vinifera]|uniref:Uncharacterized protein n=1 Tax=Vitis vinifera TaxID=29760 RepID=A0ABY9D1I7_VITVI|nr:hypothetical protein VitviT2T_019695 [Vitis vinifera]
MNRDVNKICSNEFLCKENLVKTKDLLGHFMVETLKASSFCFCRNPTKSLLPSSLSS